MSENTMSALVAGLLTLLGLALVTSYLGVWRRSRKITILALISGFLSGLMFWFAILEQYRMDRFYAVILGCLFSIVFSVLIVGGAYYQEYIRKKSKEYLRSRGLLNNSDPGKNNSSNT